jgi:Cu/Zn superoxide dismutase
MTKTHLLAIVLAVAACGGGKKKQTTPPPDQTAEAKTETPPPTETPAEKPTEPKKEEPPPPPPPPKKFEAKAALEPAKGAKVKPVTVTFTQEEGKDTTLAADNIEGLTKGTYHLVIHEGAECGPNGTKAGKEWAGGADAKMGVTVGADKKAALATTEVKAPVGGDTSIVGHTLALHADAKGKAGKLLACGPITKSGE